MKNLDKKNLLLPTLSLFTSMGTLLCCALPALFVSLGMGAVLAGLVGEFPAITFISKHKIIVFILALILITLAGIMLYNARNLPCPADVNQAKACARLRKISIFIYYFSVVTFIIGFFFAFIAKYFVA